jgi:hypothetical protein
MSNPVDSQPKQLLSSATIADSQWVKVYKDRMLSNGGYELEYWRVDRSDTANILTRQKGRFILPEPQLRPGIKKRTLDFIGGRVDARQPHSNQKAAHSGNRRRPVQIAEKIVRREFQLDDAVPLDLKPLTPTPLYVDSSFSSQKLYGYVVELPIGLQLPGTFYTAKELFEQLRCLQCRTLLMEWIHFRRLI